MPRIEPAARLPERETGKRPGDAVEAAETMLLGQVAGTAVDGLADPDREIPTSVPLKEKVMARLRTLLLSHRGSRRAGPLEEAEDHRSRPDLDHVTVREPRRLLDPAAADEGPVLAAEVFQ